MVEGRGLNTVPEDVPGLVVRRLSDDPPATLPDVERVGEVTGMTQPATPGGAVRGTLFNVEGQGRVSSSTVGGV